MSAKYKVGDKFKRRWKVFKKDEIWEIIKTYYSYNKNNRKNKHSYSYKFKIHNSNSTNSPLYNESKVTEELIKLKRET